MSQKGVIALALPLLLLVAAAVILFILISQKIIKNPFSKSSDATVSLQTQYENPFDSKTQYQNPFSSYRNPFDTLK